MQFKGPKSHTMNGAVPVPLTGVTVNISTPVAAYFALASLA